MPVHVIGGSCSGRRTTAGVVVSQAGECFYLREPIGDSNGGWMLGSCK